MNLRTEIYIMRECCSLALNNIDDDTFDHAQKCNDWRNHVPDEVADVWNHLSRPERALVALVADHAASAEDWD